MQKTKNLAKPALLFIVMLAFLLGACSRNKLGLLEDVQEKYPANSFYNQIDESMIRAAANIDSSQTFNNVDQYIEQILSFQLSRDHGLYDSDWADTFIENINPEKYESLIEFKNDSLQLSLFMLKGSSQPKILDLIIYSNEEIRFIEIKGDQPMGITNTIFKTVQSGGNPLEALSQFGL